MIRLSMVAVAPKPNGDGAVPSRAALDGSEREVVLAIGWRVVGVLCGVAGGGHREAIEFLLGTVDDDAAALDQSTAAGVLPHRLFEADLAGVRCG